MRLFKRAIAASAVGLARLGLIDEARGRRIADLAWPRVVTGLARMSQRTADFVMVGIAIGPAAIAGMGFAFAYWMVAISVGFSLANGGMTFLSQRYGADDIDGMNLVFKQTFLLELVLAGAFTLAYVGLAERLVGLLGASPESLAYGTIYLQVVVLGLAFEATAQLAGRVLLCANDAWTPMVLRAGGALANVVLNAVFIFGLGLGVFGAALGTVLASIFTATALLVGIHRGRLPGFGELPVRFSPGGPYLDVGLITQVLEVGLPLVARRVVSRASQFFMLAIMANFGTIVVAAYVASREVRNLANTPGWGFGTAARSLVGQALGSDDDDLADAYGWDILRFSVVVYAAMALLMFALAGPIADLFVDDPAAVAATVPFIRVMAISLLGLSVDSATSGVISAGGDTRWPLYARLLGLYVFMIPIAYLGVISPLGITAVYVAVMAETVVPGVVTFARFKTGRWIDVSRQYRGSPAE